MTGEQLAVAQEHFVELLPDLQNLAGGAFKHLPASDREEAVAEAVALSWQNFLNHSRDGDDLLPASSLAFYAIKDVRKGRGVCGQNATDVMARRTQLLGRATVQHLDSAPGNGYGQCAGEMWDPSVVLMDRRTWEQPQERVRVKLDYGGFAQRHLTAGERRLFTLLAYGYRPCEAAAAMQVSAPRVSQLRCTLGRKLVQFMGRGILLRLRQRSG